MASSHFLAAHSVVFDKMLFSAVQMEESTTNVVHLDDVLMADFDLLLKFHEFRLNSSSEYFSQLEIAHVMSLISISHRFEFTEALFVLSNRFSSLVSVPTSSDLQFADRLELLDVLAKWSTNCTSPQKSC